MTKSSFYKLVKITMLESFFIFDWKFYEQYDAVAMSFPLGPTLANVFMCHFENIGNVGKLLKLFQTNCL